MSDATTGPAKPSVSPTVRLFTHLRRPSWRHLLGFLIVFILFLVVSTVPADVLHSLVNRSLWLNERLGSRKQLSAAMMWLLAANLTSLSAVFLLALDLWTLSKMLRGCSFYISPQFLEKHPKFAEKAKADPLNWALRPLDFTYVLSITALLLTFYLTVRMLWHPPMVSSELFSFLIYSTGLVYLLIMTSSDIGAMLAFRRVTCLRQEWPADCHDDVKVNRRRKFDQFVEALGDYERILFYVDVPMLFSLVVLLVHKHSLPSDAYYTGFVAGTIAMHTILANIISLIIAASSMQPQLEAPNETV